MRLEVKVAGGIKTFCVHESILTEASPVFEGALKGNWQESANKIYTLDGDDVALATVNRFVQWLYHEV